MRHHSKIALFLCIILFVFSLPPAHGADFTVTNCAWSGVGTLQQAITDANNSGGGVIAINCTPGIIFAYPLTIDSDITILGGALDGWNISSHFIVNTGVTFTLQGTVLLKGFQTSTTGEVGGSITNNGGTVILKNINALYNKAAGTAFNMGGMIYNAGVLTIEDSNIQYNTRSAIYNIGTLTITNSTLSANTSDGDGAGIYNTGTVNLTDVVAQYHEARNGGFIYNMGEVNITDSLFLRNDATESGGGIYNLGTMTVENIFFDRNVAQDGGAVYNAGTLTIQNNVFSKNQALGRGGAIWNVNNTTISIHNTFANNSAVIDANTLLVTGGTISAIHTIISETGVACVTETGGIFNLNQTNFSHTPCGDATVSPDIKITELWEQNIYLRWDSPALNAYPAPCIVATDRRGIARPENGGCDAGAIEMHAFTVDECTYANLASAVTSANVVGGIVTLTCNGTIMMDNPLSITSIVNIHALGDVILDGGGLKRHFTVLAGSLWLDNMTLQNGGLGLSTFGQSIYVFRGNLAILNSIIRDNVTTNQYNEGNGAITTVGDRDDVNVLIENSQFINNRSFKLKSGGAIQSSGNLTVRNSLFANNTSIGTGGAVYTSGTGQKIFINNTFVNNSAVGAGGAVLVVDSVTFIHNTFVNNTASNGGAIHAIRQYTLYVTADNNIISGTGSQCVTGPGTFDFDASNISNVACGNATVFADLGLQPFNGRIVPLSHTSPAIDYLTIPCAVETDQLGNIRPYGDGCDVGAHEYTAITFTEQELLIALQTESVASGWAVYPWVLDIIPEGIEITMTDENGQVGTALLVWSVDEYYLNITIQENTSSFAQTIYQELPAITMRALDNLLAHVDLPNELISGVVLYSASVAFEVGE